MRKRDSVPRFTGYEAKRNRGAWRTNGMQSQFKSNTKGRWDQPLYKNHLTCLFCAKKMEEMTNGRKENQQKKVLV